MKVLLSSGFRDSRILNLEQNSIVDPKIVDNKNKKYREFATQYLIKEYNSIKNSVDATNKKLKKSGGDLLVLPKFDVVEFSKTGNLSRDTYQLFEYGDPYKNLAPRQAISKLRSMIDKF